jgi:hypothetical protein
MSSSSSFEKIPTNTWFMVAGNVLTSTMLVSILLTFLFFAYAAATVEQEIVRTQSEMIARVLADDMSIFLPQPLNQTIAARLEFGDLSAQDAAVMQSNAELQKKVLMVLGIGTGVMALILVPFFTFLPWEQLIIKNLGLLIGVGLTEIAFLNLVTKNYAPVDPNFVRNRIVKLFRNKFQNDSDAKR